MICAFRLQGIQPPGHQISSPKSSRMSPIIDTRHHQSNDEENGCKTHGLLTHRAASLFSRVNQCSQESENRSRGAECCGRCSSEGPGKRGEKRPHPATEKKAGDAGGGVNDHSATDPVFGSGGGCQMADPHHVEPDVQQTPVEPAGTQHSPPSSGLKNRYPSTRAK